MARPREFEPDEALNQAMELFWRNGYEETSIDDLVAATGVSRYGFYTEFGDKHDLFLKCIDLYANTAIEHMLSPMERDDASLKEIRGYFASLLAGAANAQGPAGCLIGNTAMTAAAWDEAVTGRINFHFARMRAAFLNALHGAVGRGELALDEDLESLADYLVGVANGYLAGIRSMAPVAVRHYVEMSLQRLA